VDGEVVSRIRLYERRIRLGNSIVRCGMIGDVCTHPDHRHKGYGSGCLRDAIDYFRTQGIHMSIILSGVFGFYGSEHWEKFPMHSYTGPVEHLRVPVREIYHVRRFERDEDLHAVIRIYDEYCEGRSLTVVRSPEYWRRHFYWRTGEDMGYFLIAEDEQRITGYVREPGRFTRRGNVISELCYLPGHEVASFDLLEACIRIARKAHEEKLGFLLPADSPPLDAIKACEGVTEEVSETTLLRIIDLRQLLWELLPELNDHLSGNATRFEGAITFKVLDQQAGLRVRRNEVRLLEVPTAEAEIIACDQPTFFKMITGYAPASQVYLPGVPDNVVEVLDKLFPKGTPIFWPTDAV